MTILMVAISTPSLRALIAVVNIEIHEREKTQVISTRLKTIVLWTARNVSHALVLPTMSDQLCP